MTLTADSRDIDTKFLGFVVSPHEECAVEEAVRIIETHGGASVVMTLGPEAATDQLRDAMAVGIDRAVLLETDGSDWDPVATAAALVDEIRALEASAGPFDLILFGNEFGRLGRVPGRDPGGNRPRPADRDGGEGAGDRFRDRDRPS